MNKRRRFKAKRRRRLTIDKALTAIWVKFCQETFCQERAQEALPCVPLDNRPKPFTVEKVAWVPD